MHQRFLMDFPSALDFLTQFGCSFVLLRSLSRLLNLLGLLMMLAFCFKVLGFISRFKVAIRFLCDAGGIPRIRLCPGNVVPRVSDPKAKPFKRIRRRGSKSSFRRRPSGSWNKGNAASEEGSEGKGANEREVFNEDEVFDEMTLGKFLEIERQKANAACQDLEKERTAAASSAEEAMAMILRLQNEKSTAEIQATQFRRMAEQKLDYDQEIIESLQWSITQHETQKCELEDQLEMVREELRQFMRDDEIEQIEVEVSRGYNMYDDDEDGDPDGDPNGNFVVSSPITESHTL
ncbi:hypothetical protein Fmac_005150 [Flemingia macrophylla]|uniref:GTD-binding domain-containing protein n=1 Tax=Flemingia macrophylla TaxID=520843 RepID=A0ABD1N9J9_9FABA